jgi:DNA modification methylase
LNSRKCNDLSGKEWLQNSFSIWRDLSKTSEERAFKHPASFPISLCKKVIRTFSPARANVIDPFNGIGSTTTAAAELGCTAVGIDLSKNFCEIAAERVVGNEAISIINNDSFIALPELPRTSFDICVTSPPYWDILNMKHSADKRNSVNYSDKDEDLGNILNYQQFVSKLTELFFLLCSVLKPNAYCIVNVMDIRKKSSFFPLHSDLITSMQKIGYIFDDLVIWDRQSDYNNMRPLGYPYKFRINKVHEYILIFINQKGAKR